MPPPRVLTGAAIPSRVHQMVHKIRQVIEYGQTTAINQNSILEVPVASITAVTMDDSPRLMDITYEFKASVIVKVIELAGRPLPFQETRTLSISVQGIPEIPGNSVDTFLRNLKDNETPWDDVLGAADRIIQHLHFLGQLPGLSTAMNMLELRCRTGRNDALRCIHTPMTPTHV